MSTSTFRPDTDLSFWDDLVDDVGAFDAALAFVEDFTTLPSNAVAGLASSASKSLPDSVTVCSATTKTPAVVRLVPTPPCSDGNTTGHKTKQRPRRHRRDRVREELLQLRETVEILQQQYDALSIVQCLDTPRGITVDGNGLGPTAMLWKAVAKRQRDEEMRAHEENQRLRDRLCKHLQVAKAWERLLQRGSEDDTYVWNVHESAELTPLVLPMDEIDVFDQMEARVSMLYKEYAGGRDDARFARALGSSRTSRVLTEANGMPTEVENFISEIVPFSLETSDLATWQFLERHFARDFTMVFGDWKKDDDPDVIRRCYKIDVHHPRITTCLDGKTVIRRYFENDCIVIVAADMFWMHSVSGVPMEGSVFRKDSWSVVSRFQDTDTIATQFASKHVSKIVTFPQTPGFESKLQVLTQFIANAVNLRVDAGLQVFENLLMDFHSPSQLG